MAAAAAKVAYLFLFFFSVLIASCLRIFGDDLVKHFDYFIQCGDNSHCFGNQAVYRVSLATCVFFFPMMVFSAMAPDFHSGWWCLKVPYYGILLISTFIAKNDIFGSYAEVARVGSSVFLILQIVLLVDFSYSLHEYIIDKIEESENDEEASENLLPKDEIESSSCYGSTIWRAIFLSIGFGCFGASVGFTIWMFTYFGECSIGDTFVSITLCAMVILTGLSISILSDVGLISPSIVSGYLAYLCWQSLGSHPDPQCNPSAEYSKEHSTLTSGILLASFTLTWTCWRTSSSSGALFNINEVDSEAQMPLKSSLTDNEEGLTECDETRDFTVKESENPEDMGACSVWQFHAVMMLGSLYMAMALTNWEPINGFQPGEDRSTSIINVWVKIGSQWATIVIYMWSLIAPYVFPDRDFGR